MGLAATATAAPKFLLVKLNHLGDTLLLTPTLRLLRQRFPNARIDVVVRQGSEAVLAGNPDVSNVMVVAAPAGEERATTRRRFFALLRSLWCTRYDYAFDLSNSDRAKLLVLASRAAIRGINDSYLKLGWKRRLFNRFSGFAWGREHQVLRDCRTVTDIVFPDEEAPLADQVPALVIDGQLGAARRLQVLPELDAGRPYAVIHPVSRWQFKQWLPEYWAAVADRLGEQEGLQVVFSCGPDAGEQAYVRSILAICRRRHETTDGKLTIRELAGLQQEARLFLGVDTVAMHLAAAVQVPSVVLFGPSSEWSWHPWQCRYELVLGDCSCKRTRQFVCDKSTVYPCMAGITVDTVLAAAGKLLHDR